MNAAYSDWQAALLCAALAIPALSALLLVHATVARRTFAVDLAAWSALPACLVAITLPEGHVELRWLMLGSRLGVDATGRVFLAFTAVLWLAAGVYARGYLRDDVHVRRFFGFFLLSMVGNLGLVLAQDGISFFVFFTLMSFAAYGLVVHDPTAENLRAGRIYIVLAIIGEVLLFSALVLLADGGDAMHFPLAGRAAAGDPLVIALVALGFGIKAGALPVHVWLPLAHPAAPTPASAVLSGAMIKAGLLGWLRFLPLGEVTMTEFAVVFVTAGVLAAFYGVALGLVQQNPKTILAYSSISQMGFMTAALGMGWAAPDAWPALLGAALVYAVHHGLAKGALFLGVGLVAHRARRALVLVGMGFVALALAGAPLTSGALAKSMLKAALPAAHAYSSAVAALLTAAALGTTLLMTRLLYVLHRQRGHAPGGSAGWLWLAWTVSLLAVAGGALAVTGVAPQRLFDAGIWTAAWPVIGGVVLALSIWRLMPREARLPGWLRIPAGDLVVPAEAATKHLLTVMNATTSRLHDPFAALHVKASALSLRVRDWLLRWEGALADWSNVGLWLLGILLTLFLLLALPGPA